MTDWQLGFAAGLLTGVTVSLAAVVLSLYLSLM